MDDLLTSPLHDRHVALGATLGAFGGWSMPLSYPDGTVAEHTAVREAVGVFDVSHLGKLAITGPGAAEFVNRCFTADLGKIGPGHAQYTLCCTPEGGVVDDLIVYLVGPDEVLAVPNAANSAQVAELLRAAAPAGIEIRDRHRDLAVIAVQGPRSAELFATVFGGLDGVTGLDYMAFTDAGAVRVCRTGYTGERGYELLVPADEAPGVWDALLAGAGPLGGRPAGLAARDTLRTEMGYPLHGQDLSVDISPGSGRQQLGGRMVEARVLGPRRPDRREGGRPRPPAAGVAGHRTRRPPCGDGGAARRRAGRDHHVGHVLPDPEDGHRAGSGRHRGRGRARTPR